MNRFEAIACIALVFAAGAVIIAMWGTWLSAEARRIARQAEDSVRGLP